MSTTISNAEEDCIRAIHASPYRVVIAASGGGSSAISALLNIPGGSDTLLEAIVPYCEASLTSWLGATPERFCKPETALRMATVAFRRARELSPATPDLTQPNPAAPNPPLTDRLLGLGATCSLASEPPKRGPHRIHVAVQSKNSTQLYSLELAKGARDRSGEEAIASQVVLRALAIASGAEPLFEVATADGEALTSREQRADPLLAEVWSGETASAWSLPDGSLDKEGSRAPVGLLSGSFDPFHRGHAALQDAAEKHLGGAVYFELPIVNAEKPPIDFLTLRDRLAQPFGQPVLLTAVPIFVEKARIAPGTVFVIGVDTAVRVVDARFHAGRDDQLREALADLLDLRCRFLVAGRYDDEHFMTLADVEIPTGFEVLFEELPEAEFRVDLSSTQIRRGQHRSG